MNPKMRANFINSVASGQKIICPSCNTLNDADSSFCMTCGTKLEGAVTTTDESSSQPAFNSTSEATANKQSTQLAFNTVNESNKVSNDKKLETTKSVTAKRAFNFVEPDVEEIEEPVSAFAQGLPSWDIVPPHVMVRRKPKK